MPGPTGHALTDQAAKVVFAQDVAKGTGLELSTALAWVRAENGPNNNFLGIMAPGTTTLESFSSPEAAAAATVSFLHQPQFASILTTAASTHDPKTELTAIADSPWDTGKAGPKPSYLQTLLGSLAANTANPGLSTVPGAGASAAPLPLPSLTGWVGDVTGWIQGEAAKGLAYVVLVGLGLALVMFGALDTFGYSPKRVAGAVATPSPVKEEIPF